jgi:DegV family protein with EDD domain
MPKIAVITDTDSTLPLNLAKKFNIAEVPILIQFGDESFEDTFEINNPVLFARIDKEGKLPKTSAPSSGKFLEAFNNAFKKGADAILCFNISSEMSATYTSARQAAEMLPGKRIEVIDTRSLAMGQGYMVLAAAETIAKGGKMEDAIAAAEDVCKRTFLFGSLATLKYIAMSGRVGYLAAGLAAMLDIKPILTLAEGKLSMLEKIRTQRKSWKRAVELSLEKVGGKKIESMAIQHVNALESAKKFEDMLRFALPCPEEILITDMTPGLSCHTGAGTVAVICVTAK